MWSRFFIRSLIAAALTTGVTQADEEVEFFERKIRPLLLERCEGCHSTATTKTSGGLALDSREGWQRGGDSGTAIIPGRPDESLLIIAVRHDPDGPQMPPVDAGGRLPDAAVELLEEWVRRGAPDPRTAAVRIGGMTHEEARDWWSFQPIRPINPPPVSDVDWPLSGIDRFILAKLELRGLVPAAKADRRTLIRRAAFDLTGLPPTPEEVEQFISDDTDDAFARLVDRLLDSPAYGQRWARHWLDVARYADYYDANPATRVASCELTEAWRYRDWVVDALNADLPFDQFIIHQIAGDLLPANPEDGLHRDGLIATTFLSNGVWDRGDADKEKIVSDMVDDNIDIVGRAFLGLTLGCARCHDHKFDPVSTEDYYALAGIFYSSHILQDLGAKGGEYTMNRVPLVASSVVTERNRQLEQISRLTSLLEAFDKQEPPLAADDPQRLPLTAERDQLQRELIPEPPLAMAVQESGTPGGLFPDIQDVPIHVRGSYTRLGEVVARGMPKFLAGSDQLAIITGSGRRELAMWVSSPENPLTARVIVNRVWQWHFGEGLVSTPSNFGKLGSLPSHPELLDWLAAAFMESGWSLKTLHRRIMLSATYQQSCRPGQYSLENDVENRWLSRFSSRRLEAEAIRDAILHVSGQLDFSAGGPAADDFTVLRRSLYVQTARWDRGSYATLFDAANPDSSTEKRSTSTVAPQALLLLNHPFVQDQARHLAERLFREVSHDTSARIDWAYRLLFSRSPTQQEQELARELITHDTPSGWIDLAHVLLCSNEFAYLD